MLHPGMHSPPPTIGPFRVICYSPIDERHRFTGNTRQIVNGALMDSMLGLLICQSAENEFYLFGCDADWNDVTDTWHESVEDAKKQAEFEYEGVGKTWVHFE